MEEIFSYKPRASVVGAFISPFKAVTRVKEYPVLRKYFIIPFILNVVVLSGIFYFSYTTLSPWLSGFLQGDAWYIAAARYVLEPLLVIILAITTALLYSILGNIITAPFNDFLSESVEKNIYKENLDERFLLGVLVKDILRSIKNVLLLLLLLVGVNIVLLVLNIIPVLGNVLYSVLNMAVTFFFMGFQFFDFPLERRRCTFREKLYITRRIPLTVAALGAAFFVMTFIPILGFLGLNLATIGATEIFSEKLKPALSSQWLASRRITD